MKRILIAFALILAVAPVYSIIVRGSVCGNPKVEFVGMGKVRSHSNSVLAIVRGADEADRKREKWIYCGA